MAGGRYDFKWQTTSRRGLTRLAETGHIAIQAIRLQDMLRRVIPQDCRHAERLREQPVEESGKHTEAKAQHQRQPDHTHQALNKRRP